MVILICYDGSPDAQAAIDHAARLYPGAAAEVLVVWDPMTKLMARSGAGLAYGAAALDYEEIDDVSHRRAQERATEGAQRACAAGLVAEARTVPARGTTASTILTVAEELDVDAIVLGTRGLGRLHSLLLGSVSRAVIQLADRPVMVIPSARLGQDRAVHRRRMQGDAVHAGAGS